LRSICVICVEPRTDYTNVVIFKIYYIYWYNLQEVGVIVWDNDCNIRRLIARKMGCLGRCVQSNGCLECWYFLLGNVWEHHKGERLPFCLVYFGGVSISRNNKSDWLSPFILIIMIIIIIIIIIIIKKMSEIQ